MACCCNKSNATDLTKIQDLLHKYRDIDGSLITILQGVQEIYGYLPMDVILHIAEQTGIKPAKVMGVATFYTQFRFEAVGEYLIMLCQGTACHVNGSERIEQAITEELGITGGQTTGDGLFTLTNVACLGCCSLSPVMMINGETYGNLTQDKVKTILRDLRNKALEAQV